MGLADGGQVGYRLGLRLRHQGTLSPPAVKAKPPVGGVAGRQPWQLRPCVRRVAEVQDGA